VQLGNPVGVRVTCPPVLDQLHEGIFV